MYILKILTFQHIFFLIFSDQNTNPSPRTGPQNLLVTHYDCEENEQNTLHKYAINQVTQCKTVPQAMETTNVRATLYSQIIFRSTAANNFLTAATKLLAAATIFLIAVTNFFDHAATNFSSVATKIRYFQSLSAA